MNYRRQVLGRVRERYVVGFGSGIRASSENVNVAVRVGVVRVIVVEGDHFFGRGRVGVCGGESNRRSGHRSGESGGVGFQGGEDVGREGLRGILGVRWRVL